MRVFCKEFGFLEKLTFNSSKEEMKRGTEFMKQIRTHDINYHISETVMHNENPCKGIIREIRRQ